MTKNTEPHQNKTSKRTTHRSTFGKRGEVMGRDNYIKCKEMDVLSKKEYKSKSKMTRSKSKMD